MVLGLWGFGFSFSLWVLELRVQVWGSSDKGLGSGCWVSDVVSGVAFLCMLFVLELGGLGAGLNGSRL